MFNTMHFITYVFLKDYKLNTLQFNKSLITNLLLSTTTETMVIQKKAARPA